jgi:NAD(P)-dependent dehydrogenase (short-subunit alcohol dehydrogenase family)
MGPSKLETDKKADLLHGKVCLITGSSSGIGKATASGLAALGATVVLACRDSGRGEAARQEIIRESNNQSVSVGLVDLARLDSVRSFADDFRQKYSRLDALVNNAGIYASRRIVTADGFESTFAVNHLAHFLLTNLLLELMKASAPSRIVNVSSEAQSRGHINFNDLQGERKYSGWKSYPQSKLANVLFTYELARRLEGTGVTVNCVHPGTVRTNFARNNGGFMGLIVRVFAPFMLSPEQGARTVVWLASSPEVEYSTGKYFANRSELRSSSESYDLEVAKHLWEVSRKLTGLGLGQV